MIVALWLVCGIFIMVLGGRCNALEERIKQLERQMQDEKEEDAR